MAGPKSSASLALLLALSLVVSFSLVAACTDNCTEECSITEKCKVEPPKKEEPPPPCHLEKCKVPLPPQLPPAVGKCPMDTLKLGVCADVLGGLLNVTLGRPPLMPCCGLLRRLVDLEAAVCLCTALSANVLGIRLNLPAVSLQLLLNYCGKKVPAGFICK